MHTLHFIWRKCTIKSIKFWYVLQLISYFNLFHLSKIPCKLKKKKKERKNERTKERKKERNCKRKQACSQNNCSIHTILVFLFHLRLGLLVIHQCRLLHQPQFSKVSFYSCNQANIALLSVQALSPKKTRNPRATYRRQVILISVHFLPANLPAYIFLKKETEDKWILVLKALQVLWFPLSSSHGVIYTIWICVHQLLQPPRSPCIHSLKMLLHLMHTALHDTNTRYYFLFR